MNANIFSCTGPPLLVLETQIIHPELLQSLCINPCVLLGSIFLANVCARARADVCARAHLSVHALTCLRLHIPVRARPLPSARALRQRGSRFDMSASLKLPTVKKKNW